VIGRRSVPEALLAAALVAAFCAVLIAVIVKQHNGGSVHVERAQRFGSEAALAANAMPVGTSLKVAGSATWDLLGYEFARLGAASLRCSADVYVTGTRLYGRSRDAWADVLFDGKLVARVAVNQKHPEAFVPAARKRLYPAVPAAPVFFSPLYRPAGFVFPLSDPAACRSQRWRISVRVHHAVWLVESTGAYLWYEPPQRLVAGSLTLTVALAALLAALIFAPLVAAFASIRERFGIGALAVAWIITIFATLTHDQWDFPVWIRFVNLTAFGGGNPALMWSGTPLWPWLMAIFTPIPLAFYAFAHHASSEITALFVKLAAVGAYLWTAYVLALVAPKRVRTTLFWIALLSPLGLYELAAGYREIFAGLCAVLGLTLALRERYVAGTLLFVAAASISESLLPLLLATPAMALTFRTGTRTCTVAFAIGLLVLGVAGIAVQWAALPHAFAGQSLAFRAHSYRYGEGSWLGLLTFYRNVPAWVGALWSTWIALAVFLAIAAAFAVRLFAARDRNTVLACVAGFVLAFFLSYRGVDISTWYALLVVLTFVFYAIDPLNPYPLLVSATAAACQYAVAGTRDFVNWTYLWPVDKGLFSVLGQPVHVFAGVTIGLIAAGAAALLLGRTALLFSRATPAFGAVFVLAGYAVTIRTHALDVIFCVAVTVLLAVTLYRLWRLRGIASPWAANGTFTVFAAVFLAAATFAFAASDLYWALVGVTLIVVAFTYGTGLCDLPLAIGSLWLLRSEIGFGWLSFVGYVALLVLCAVLVWNATRESPRWRLRESERG
jgi:hypothetical protein